MIKEDYLEDDVCAFLEHVGVKGMKWGQRKDRAVEFTGRSARAVGRGAKKTYAFTRAHPKIVGSIAVGTAFTALYLTNKISTVKSSQASVNALRGRLWTHTEVNKPKMLLSVSKTFNLSKGVAKSVGSDAASVAKGTVRTGRSLTRGTVKTGRVLTKGTVGTVKYTAKHPKGVAISALLAAYANNRVKANRNRQTQTSA